LQACHHQQLLLSTTTVVARPEKTQRSNPSRNKKTEKISSFAPQLAEKK
jgi:hypothetical protein